MDEPRTIGPYTLYEPIGSGGMASVHFGRRLAAGGFARAVAIKRVRAELASDPNVAAMLLDEARLTARIHHPNVVPTIDVVLEGGELFLVLEYVHGESLARLLRALPAGEPLPFALAVTIVRDVLRGLHAAHEAKGEGGAPLELVHRDVCPHNIIVDVDGVARVHDFGVAKARNRAQETATGQLKGRLRYMAPEQVHGDASRRSDVFAVGVVLWELVTGAALFAGDSDAETLAQVLGSRIPRPKERGLELPEGIEAALMRALDRRPEARFETAEDFAAALETIPETSRDAIGSWVRSLAQETLDARERRLRELGRSESSEEEVAALPLPSSRSPAPRSRRSRFAIVVAVLCLSLVLVLVLVLVGERGRPAGPTPLASAEPERSGASGAPPIGDPPRAAHAPPSTTDSDPIAETVASATKFSSPAPAARPPAPRRAPSAKSSCEPPYLIDPTGVKVFKRECFPNRR